MIKFQIGILVVRYHYIETTVMIITHRGVQCSWWAKETCDLGRQRNGCQSEG